MKKKDKQRVQLALFLAGIAGASGLFIYWIIKRQQATGPARITSYGYPRY